jgi:hypothetical protein
VSRELSSSLLDLEPGDRVRLGEALRMLLDRGSILGGDGQHAELYHWAYQNRPWIEEMCGLFDLQIAWENELRLVQAVPCSGTFLLRLRLDATLVVLTLWYEFDAAVRDRGQTPPIFITVEQLNDALRTKFEPLRKTMPAPSRLLEILRLAQRKNLVRVASVGDPAQTRIEVLPTIKRVIPFQDIADWTRHAERFLAGESASATSEAEVDEDAED